VAASAGRILAWAVGAGVVPLLSGCLAMSLSRKGPPDEALVQTLVLETDPVTVVTGESHDAGQPEPLRTAFVIEGWMHGFETEVVDGNGEVIPLEYHVKVMAPQQRELFSPLMLRLVGSAAETGEIRLPRHAGYPFSAGDSLLITAMLHPNYTDGTLPDGGRIEGVQVRIRMFYSEPGPWSDPASVFPIFTHVTEPGTETFYDMPPGISARCFDVTPAVDGTVIALGGHLHRYGAAISLEEIETGKVLWSTTAERSPDGEVLAVPPELLVRAGGIELKAGRGYRIKATYDNPTGGIVRDGAMGTLGGVYLTERPWPAVDPDDPIYQWDVARERVPAAGHSMTHEGGTTAHEDMRHEDPSAEGHPMTHGEASAANQHPEPEPGGGVCTPMAGSP